MRKLLRVLCSCPHGHTILSSTDTPATRLPPALGPVCTARLADKLAAGGAAAMALGYGELLRALPTDLLRPCLMRILEVRLHGSNAQPAIAGCWPPQPLWLLLPGRHASPGTRVS